MMNSTEPVLLSPALIKSDHQERQEGVRHHITFLGKRQPLQDEDDRGSSLEM